MRNPSILPNRITSQDDVARTIGRIIKETRAGVVSVATPLAKHDGASGTHIVPPYLADIQCFKVTSCWYRDNPPPALGGNLGRFWACDAEPVWYWWGHAGKDNGSSSSLDGCGDLPRQQDPNCNPPEDSSGSTSGSGADSGLDSFWREIKMDKVGATRIFWVVDSPEDTENWQQCLYPLYGLGQWVWCVFDYAASVWRVLHAYDDQVRFRLCQPLFGCGSARAVAVGYDCDICPTSGSSSSSSSGSTVFHDSSTGSSGSSSSGSEGPIDTHTCRVVKDVKFNSVTCVLEVEYCTIHLGVGGWCDCGDGSGSGGSGGGGGGGGHSHSGLGSSSASSSSSEQHCLQDAVRRGLMVVHDPQAIVNSSFIECIAPEGATGWAKWCSDSRRFEVVSIGDRHCTPGLGAL